MATLVWRTTLFSSAAVMAALGCTESSAAPADGAGASTVVPGTSSEPSPSESVAATGPSPSSTQTAAASDSGPAHTNPAVSATVPSAPSASNSEAGQGAAGSAGAEPSPSASGAAGAEGEQPGVMADSGAATPSVPSSAEGETALQALEEHLLLPRDERPALSDEAFARVPLDKAQASAARQLLWDDYRELIESTRRQEFEAKVIAQGELQLRFDYTTFGDKPATGRSLFLSLHGGGNAEPSVNDEQWENQKQLYQPEEGVYLSPRAPTDTWNLWHEAHIDPMFERLIADLIVFEDVDPNRVYVMGYSAGGDGVYQLGPRMADHWAAASAMAGHPNEAQPLSLRNIGFTVHVGALDTAYDRNLIAGQWGDRLDELQAADPEGYVHLVQIHAGKEHWMDLEDAVAVPWMADFTRDPLPKKIVWLQDDITHTRFYWLAVPSDAAVKDALINAELEAQHVALSVEGTERVRVRLTDAMLDLDQPVSISVAGVEHFADVAPRTIYTLYSTLEERGDPALVFDAEVEIEL